MNKCTTNGTSKRCAFEHWWGRSSDLSHERSCCPLGLGIRLRKAMGEINNLGHQTPPSACSSDCLCGPPSDGLGLHVRHCGDVSLAVEDGLGTQAVPSELLGNWGGFLGAVSDGLDVGGSVLEHGALVGELSNLHRTSVGAGGAEEESRLRGATRGFLRCFFSTNFS